MWYIKYKATMIKLAILIGLSSSFYFYISSIKNEVKTLKNDKKIQKEEILKLKKQIVILNKNNKVDTVNTEIKTSIKNTIEEIKKLKEKDKHEELAAHDHDSNYSNILGGLYLISPGN